MATEMTSRGPTKVLLLEDNVEDARLVVNTLAAAELPIEAEQVQSLEEFKERLASNAYDLILCDFALPGCNGLDVLRWVRQSGHDTPFIYFSGTFWGDNAVDCIREGAADYVRKSDLSRLPHAVHRALSEQELRRRHRYLEQEKRKSEEEYRLLFESNPQPMWVVDCTKHTFLAVNQAAIWQYGYSRDEFLQMTDLDLQSKPESSDISGTILGQGPHGIASRASETHRKKDGTLIFVEISCNQVNFRGVDAMLVLAQDVSDLVRNEQKLRQSEERFFVAFRRSPMPITISTRDEGRYLDVNEAFLRLMGRRRHQVVGHTAFELGVWESTEDRAKAIEELDRTGAIDSFKTVIHSPTVGRRSVEISAELIELDGIPCVLAITDDVTEEKIVEERLRQSQKLEAVGRLAGGIAHDFNNMLGVIMGYCDLAESRTDHQKVRGDVVHIKKAAQRASALTTQLLAFGRQQVLRPSILNVNTVVAGVLQMLRRVISADICLTFSERCRGGNIRADVSQLEQVLLNLVVNSRDAMADGGTILIETADVELDDNYATLHPGVHAGRYVALSVIDTGCGMSAEMMSKIFEPFFTTKLPGKGTGLGLSMVYGAMKQAGGHIDVASEQGKGTAFRLYFPRVEEETERHSFRVPDLSRRGSEVILLVEDERDLREVTAKLLRNEGYTVLEAKDGATAITVSTHHIGPIHVLLSDVMLPDCGGFAIAARIAESRPDMKVIYTSGNNAPIDAAQESIHVTGTFLQKPFTKQALLSQLWAVLKNAHESEGGMGLASKATFAGVERLADR